MLGYVEWFFPFWLLMAIGNKTTSIFARLFVSVALTNWSETTLPTIKNTYSSDITHSFWFIAQICINDLFKL